MTQHTVAVFLVKDVTYDRRVLREAASLVEAGYAVTVYAMAPAGQASVSRVERNDGTVIVAVPMPPGPTLLRNRRTDFVDAWDRLRTGPWTAGRGFRTLARVPWWAAKASIAAGYYAMHRLPLSPVTRLLNLLAGWREWSEAAARIAEPADIYHGHDLTGVTAALAARGAHSAPLVYDVHDLFTEAGATADLPAALTRYLAHLERSAYGRASLVVTVNDGLASELVSRYGPKPMAVVHNCVPRWEPPPMDSVGPLRSRLGIARDVPVVLYHGGFSPNRGLRQLVDAMDAPSLQHARLVLLGFGPLEPELRHLAVQHRRDGRVHVLPAVDPDVLDRWIADADVAAMVNQPISRNELLSTPNKLFESIAAGVPVVTSDFPLRRRIVLEHAGGPLGAVCEPTEPGSIATAIASILDLPRPERDAMRDRCLEAARTRWNWEHEAEVLVAAYARLTRPAEEAHPSYSRA